MGGVVGTAFRGWRRGLTREGFAPLWVGKEKYKIDVLGGWALDDGKVLDRLVTYREQKRRGFT